MNVSTILDDIDRGKLALPLFQRGYVWTRNDVKKLMRSLYLGYPVGGLCYGELLRITQKSAPVDQR